MKEDKTLVKIVAACAITIGAIASPNYVHEARCSNLFEKKKTEYTFKEKSEGYLSYIRRNQFLQKLYSDKEWSSSGCSVPYDFVKQDFGKNAFLE